MLQFNSIELNKNVLFNQIIIYKFWSNHLQGVPIMMNFRVIWYKWPDFFWKLCYMSETKFVEHCSWWSVELLLQLFADPFMKGKVPRHGPFNSLRSFLFLTFWIYILKILKSGLYQANKCPKIQNDFSASTPCIF